MTDMFKNCGNLKRLLIPAYFKEPVPLPGSDWRNEDGESCVTIAANLARPVIYSRGEDSFENDIENNRSTFKPYTYRAEYYLNNESFVNVTENNFFSQISLSKVISDAGKQNGLNLSVENWKSFMTLVGAADKPSSLADAIFEEKDIYTSLIFSVLECSVDEDALKAADTKSVRTAKNLYDQIKYAMQIGYGIDLVEGGGDLSVLTVEEQEKLSSLTAEIVKNDLGVYGEMMDVIGDGLKFMGYLNTLDEWCTYIGNCIILNDLNESTKKVLDEMHEQCPSSNKPLKAALSDCKSIANDNALGLTADLMSYVAGEMSKDAAQDIFETFWDEMKKASVAQNPYIGLIWIAYNGSEFISNTLFNADAIAEKYCKMQALLEIREIVNKVYYTEKTACLNDNTGSSAGVFIEAINIMFRCLEEDCDSASAFVETVDNSFFEKIKIAFQNSPLNKDGRTFSNGSALLESISSIKKSIGTQKYTITLAWIDDLQYDYPDEYEAYKYLLYPDIKNAVIKLSKSSYVYDGTSKTPDVTVSYGNSELKPGKDYDISYSNEAGIGNASVTVTGTGQYIGTQTIKYTISLQAVSITSLKAKGAGFIVQWPASLAVVDGYQIRFSRKSNMSSAKNVKVKSGAINPTKVVKNLDAKKKYYVQIRSYKNLNGKDYYSRWSVKKSVKTKK